MLKIENLSHSYDGQAVLNNFNLEIKKGEIIALLGSSGSGKSTLIDCIAGFRKPDSGNIVVGEKIQTSKGVFTPPEKRKIGLVFQKPSLFPHMTVASNIAYGLDGNQEEKVKSWLDITKLSNHKDKYPNQISGGEQQRVAIARALAPNPDLVLLDEPFCSLDFYLRKEMREELKTMLKERSQTALIVTHEIEGALEIADQCCVIGNQTLHHLGKCSDYNTDTLRQKIREFFNQD